MITNIKKFSHSPNITCAPVLQSHRQTTHSFCESWLFEYEPKIAPLALMRGADS